MKITKLILVGYLRLSLRSIDYIEYTPKEKTQIILGSNGSGKSSLIKELSPLPAVPAEYRKGGSKEVFIEHRGKEYRLLSSFSEDGNIFEFYCDGVNLNPGRTVTVFKELVKEHFNYTPELHALATGQVLFHELSVNDRRKLFMALSDDDFSYAFSYFNRLKDRAREVQGTVTQLQKRLSSEIEGLLTSEQETALKRDSEGLRMILESLLMAKKMRTDDPVKLERDRDAIFQQFTTLVSQLQSSIRDYERIGTKTPLKTLEKMYEDASQAILQARNELSIRYSQHQKLESELKEIQASDNVNLKELEEDIAFYEEEISKAKASISLDLPWEVTDPIKSHEALGQYGPMIQDLCDRLVPYSGYAYLFTDAREGFIKVESDLYQHRDLALKEKGMISTLKSMLEHLDKHRHSQDLTECPSCHHRWNAAFNQTEYDRNQTQLQLAEESLAKRSKIIEELSERWNNYNLYNQIQSNVSHYTSMASGASWFWSYLQREHILTRHPERFLNEYNRAVSYVDALIALERSSAKKQEKLKIKAFYDAAKNKDKSKIEEGFKEIDLFIQTLQIKVRTLTEFTMTASSEISILREIENLTVQLRTVEVELERHSKETITTYFDTVLGDLINNLKVDIVQKERIVAHSSINKAVIQNTEESIANYKSELTLLNMAIEALSPKTGLIAEGMTYSINSFIQRVNDFISRVWSYPLHIDLIKPEGDDALDLDYRFTVNVNNTGSSPDIAKTSSGMREIIHLACVITYMRSIGFDYHPVFLDEFAVKMDDVHRKAAYNIIEYLIDEAGVSQVFLISHYENGYSSLSASDITVLCDANVSMPSHLTYNACAVIR